MTALAVDSEPLAGRLLEGMRPARALSLAEHLALHGPIKPARRGSLQDQLERSGLRGRGGAGFPVARKVAAVTGASGRPVVVVNGAEGEPLSDKDKFLMRHVPHLVLDGAVVLAAEIGASDVIVAVGRAARAEGRILTAAVAERVAQRLDGRVEIQVASVPDGFVSGEETALLNFLNGGLAKPTLTPPRPFERGLNGMPTLVQNTETVAHVALIARQGPDWFRRLGTHDDPGSALFTLSGAVRRPGVFEAPLGITLPELVARAGGPARPPQAVLVGGYFGTWFTASQAARLELDHAAVGGRLGARAIFVLPDVSCGVAETARITRYLAAESAGQCGPCVHGLAAIATALEQTARGRDQRARIARWCGQVDGRGACRHPSGAVRLVSSALAAFEADFAAHAHGRCTQAR